MVLLDVSGGLRKHLLWHSELTSVCLGWCMQPLPDCSANPLSGRPEQAVEFQVHPSVTNTLNPCGHATTQSAPAAFDIMGGLGPG